MCDTCRDIERPCCADGLCEADVKIGMCVCCGAEMFKEQGCWYHHSQAGIPINQRQIHLSNDWNL